MIRNRTDFRHRSRSSGFTLIELVVVITILAILSAAALPRFVSLQQDARIAKLDGIAGSLRAAAALAHAACLSQTGTGSIFLGDSCRANGQSDSRPYAYGRSRHSIAKPISSCVRYWNRPGCQHRSCRQQTDRDSSAGQRRCGTDGRKFRVEGAANIDICAATYIEAVSANGKITIAGDRRSGFQRLLKNQAFPSRAWSAWFSRVD